MMSVSTGCLTHLLREGTTGSLFVYTNVYGWNFNWKRVTGYGVFTLAKCKHRNARNCDSYCSCLIFSYITTNIDIALLVVILPKKPRRLQPLLLLLAFLVQLLAKVNTFLPVTVFQSVLYITWQFLPPGGSMSPRYIFTLLFSEKSQNI